MPRDFEQLLSDVTGKVRQVRVPRHFARYHMDTDALLPWWHRAESLHISALALARAFTEEAGATSASPPFNLRRRLFALLLVTRCPARTTHDGVVKQPTRKKRSKPEPELRP